jgi:hypothetical protein
LAKFAYSPSSSSSSPFGCLFFFCAGQLAWKRNFNKFLPTLPTLKEEEEGRRRWRGLTCKQRKGRGLT